jgi:DNA-binding NarL/FixJ family response regulator
MADAHIDELRRRYHAGARALRVVRLLDPEGGVRLIDFAQEAKAAATALRDVERATEVRDRSVREATERWEVVVARAVSLGQTVEDVAAAAGVTPRDVRAILRRRA